MSKLQSHQDPFSLRILTGSLPVRTMTLKQKIEGSKQPSFIIRNVAPNMTKRTQIAGNYLPSQEVLQKTIASHRNRKNE